MPITQERIIWTSNQYKLRIVEIRMYITMETLTYRIDRFIDGNWQRVNSRSTLREAVWYVEYIFGIQIEKEIECLN